MQSIFAKLLYEMEKRHDTVLVTIIRESGSTPRGEGAQMLVGAQGPLSGTIGGGNVENLSILHARDLIAQRCSDLHEYPLHRSDAEDIGMVCGGDVTALFTFIPGTDDLGLHQGTLTITGEDAYGNTASMIVQVETTVEEPVVVAASSEGSQKVETQTFPWLVIALGAGCGVLLMICIIQGAVLRKKIRKLEEDRL